MVRIRMKSFGRRHRPFFRICAMDSRTGRDGRAIEELGHYDPMARNDSARSVLKVSRIRYWLSVGAQPSEKVAAILRAQNVTKPGPGEDWNVPEPEVAAPTPPAAAAAPAASPTPAPAAAGEGAPTPPASS